MSKRFTEADKWQDPWFCDLPANYKLAWLYLLDACDAAGVIDLAERMANFLIGIDVDWSDFLTVCGDRIETLDNGKLWIVGFIGFQVPNGLTRNYNPHKPAIRAVEKHGLSVPITEPKPKLKSSLGQAKSKLKPSLSQACPKLEEEEEVEGKEEAEEERKKEQAVDPLECFQPLALHGPLTEWLKYKGLTKPTGDKKLMSRRKAITRAATLAKKHGVAAIVDAMDAAISAEWLSYEHTLKDSRGSPNGKPTRTEAVTTANANAKELLRNARSRR